LRGNFLARRSAAGRERIVETESIRFRVNVSVAVRIVAPDPHRIGAT